MVTEGGAREKSRRGVLGIFVGGRSSRMGHPKGLLRRNPEGPTLVEELLRSAEGAALEGVLVGDASPYVGVTPPTIVVLSDDPPGIGPLGGLRALLRHAGSTPVISVACDMPHLSAGILRALIDHPSGAPALSVRRTEEAPWEPMLTRWDPKRVVPVLDEALERGVRSFQGLFAALEVARFEGGVAWENALRDWDTPEDVWRDRGVLPHAPTSARPGEEPLDD